MMGKFNLLAPWYIVLMARLFGEKRQAEDSGYKLTMYVWRGKFYVTSWDGPAEGKSDD